MLIDLPQVHEYSMADCQDLFVSKMDDDFDDIDRYSGPNGKNNNLLRVPQDRGVRGHLSDAEPFTYTSSSESDADVFFSDIEGPQIAMVGEVSCRSISPYSSPVQTWVAILTYNATGG